MTVFLPVLWLAADPSAAEIMARVAENQDRGEALRRQVVYHQTVLGRMHRGRNKLAREHYYEYKVLPTEDGVEKERLVFRGKYEKDGKYFDYDDPDFEYKDIDIDGEILDEIAQDLTQDKESKDGVNKDLFPLTRERQQKYDFRLAGKETYNGREVFKIAFTAKKGEEWETFFGGSGEALIDVEDFEPVLIVCHQTKGMPMAVKIMLGTNIRQTGFKIAYQDFGDGLWFPVVYGGEFDVRVLFGYHRKISISMKNADVKRAKVDSSIRFAEEKP
jgi:hypothetical protein